MSKKLTFNQWRKNVLSMGWILIIVGVIWLLIEIFSGFRDPILNIGGSLFAILYGGWAVYQRRKA